MSGYENLASTRMLASHCAVCSRPLRDAESVEIGIGPDCRAKYGFDERIDPAARTEANKLIYLIADKQKGPDVLTACSRLRELGLHKLALRIFERLIHVILTKREDGRLQVNAPRSEAKLAAFRAIPGGYFDRDVLGHIFAFVQKGAVWAALRQAFPGEWALLPDGRAMQIPWPKTGSGFGDVDY